MLTTENIRKIMVLVLDLLDIQGCHKPSICENSPLSSTCHCQEEVQSDMVLTKCRKEGRSHHSDRGVQMLS